MADPKKQRAEAAALVRELLARMDRDDVRELVVTRGDLRVRVRRADRAGVAPSGASVDGEPAARPGADDADAPAAPAASFLEVKAPLTGLFYRSPSPTAQPFVQVGQTLSVGQVIGLIEAMKLFNEIRSTAAGRVRKILADSGQLVRAHQPLLEVEPL